MANIFQLPPLPANLKPIAHILKTAQEHETRDPVVTYWGRLAALQAAMVIDKKSKEAKSILLPLMEWLEKEKKVLAGNDAITSEIVATAHIENYAVKLFNWADKEDRASNFGKNVVKAFYTAGNLFDIMQVFGELTPEVAQRRKYAKWKAAYIHNCLKNGEQPTPGPMGGDDEEEIAPASEPGAGGWATQIPKEEPIPNIPAPTPTISQPIEESSSSSMKPEDVMKVQKLCKFAASAMDYEDVNTAIKNLTEALDLLHKSKQN